METWPSSSVSSVPACFTTPRGRTITAVSSDSPNAIPANKVIAVRQPVLSMISEVGTLNTNAVRPAPMTRIPLARPGLSLNHVMTLVNNAL